MPWHDYVTAASVGWIAGSVFVWAAINWGSR